MVNPINPYPKGLAVLGLFMILMGGCHNPAQKDTTDVLLKTLKGEDWAIQRVMAQAENHELHIELILPKDTAHVSENEGAPQGLQRSAVDYSKGQYFYPASTVKLPVAIFAAEWTELQPDISIITPYRIENDSTSHSIAQDLIDIFAVSDNQAFNRLYDLLGRDYVNQRMAELNIGPFRLAHRLSVSDAAAQEHPKYFFETAQRTLTFQAGPDQPLDSLGVAGMQKGIGYMQEDLLIGEPMDFSRKNYFPLSSMMKFMERLYPLDCFDCPTPLKWAKNTEAFVKTIMMSVPRKQGYDETEYPDGYVKFFFLGDSNERIDPALHLHNKVGYAYGTLTDIAYVVDTKHNLNYILGATLLVNENKIFNDNVYEYDSIGLPFLAQTARRLHELLIQAKSGR